MRSGSKVYYFEVMTLKKSMKLRGKLEKNKLYFLLTMEVYIAINLEEVH